MKGVAAILLACWTLSWAQQRSEMPVAPEIRGVVVESGTRLPVAEAEISLFAQDAGPVLLNGGWNKDPSARIRTDERGAFQLSPDQAARYRVEARKAGYIADEAPSKANAAEVSLTKEKPAAEVILYLARPGKLTGSVVDEETRKPVASLGLLAVRRRPPFGFAGPDGVTATTNTKGEFLISDLPPGEYAVEIRPQLAPEQRLRTRFTEQDLEAVDQDYEHTWWPGGHGLDAVLPLAVTSGATVFAGELRVRKVPYYRVHVRIPESNCQAGEQMHVSGQTVRSHGMSMRSLGQAACGKDILVTGFAPGSYRLLLNIDSRQAGNRASASVPFTIVRENIEIAAPLMPGVAVDAVFAAAEGAKVPDFSSIKLMLRPVDFVASPGDATSLSPGAEGKLRFEDVRPIGHTLAIFGLPPTHYVKEIRYNGALLRGNLVPLDGGAMGHALTVVVDDKPAAITGAVVSRGEPVGGAVAIARKWPPADEEPPWGWSRARTDKAGRFQIAGLAPGEYRVIAVQQMDAWMTYPALEQALAAGQKVEVDPNGLQHVTLECVTMLR